MNEQGIFAHSFDAAAFDGIVFDLHNEFFKVGESPFFVQIKCRGSKTAQYSPQGLSQKTIDKIAGIAKQLKISERSLYLVVGFFKNEDIRQMTYYIVPFSSLHLFEKNGNYRFWPAKCEEVRMQDPHITMI